MLAMAFVNIHLLADTTSFPNLAPTFLVPQVIAGAGLE